MVNVKIISSRPATNPTTDHLMTRAECRYSVVSETCCTNLGSVAERFSSISRRIRCSSSESGIDPFPLRECPSARHHAWSA